MGLVILYILVVLLHLFSSLYIASIVMLVGFIILGKHGYEKVSLFRHYKWIVYYNPDNGFSYIGVLSDKQKQKPQ